MKSSKTILVKSGALFFALALGNFSQAEQTGDSVDINFKGTFIVNDASSCNLETSELIVDLGSVFRKFIYINGRTIGVPFYIKLNDCDTALNSFVSFKFNGAEDTEIPGLIATTGAAKGIAVGIETISGEPVPLNTTGTPYPFINGSNEFEFRAYVQGEPSAIENQSIVVGSFSAAATFQLDYQ